MHRGELVPDATVIELVRERVTCLHCPGGFLLDGFPRTVVQAEALDSLLAGQDLALDAVVSFELPREDIVARLSGRRTCIRCKAVYHVQARPPRAAGICDQCGEKLVQRDDDRPEAVRVRLWAYETSTQPLTVYYQQAGILVSVSAAGAAEQVFERTIAALGIPPQWCAESAPVGGTLPCSHRVEPSA
jgi:adenylate kinase